MIKMYFSWCFMLLKSYSSIYGFYTQVIPFEICKFLQLFLLISDLPKNTNPE